MGEGARNPLTPDPLPMGEGTRNPLIPTLSQWERELESPLPLGEG